jgi:hypothetical protein
MTRAAPATDGDGAAALTGQTLNTGGGVVFA